MSIMIFWQPSIVSTHLFVTDDFCLENKYDDDDDIVGDLCIDWEASGCTEWWGSLQIQLCILRNNTTATRSRSSNQRNYPWKCLFV